MKKLRDENYYIGRKEIKIVALLSYYFIVFLFYITFSIVLILLLSEQDGFSLDDFFCEAIKLDPSQSCTSSGATHSTNAFFVSTVVLDVLYPLVNLLYVSDGLYFMKVMKKITNVCNYRK